MSTPESSSESKWFRVVTNAMLRTPRGIRGLQSSIRTDITSYVCAPGALEAIEKLEKSTPSLARARLKNSLFPDVMPLMEDEAKLLESILAKNGSTDHWKAVGVINGQDWKVDLVTEEVIDLRQPRPIASSHSNHINHKERSRK